MAGFDITGLTDQGFARGSNEDAFAVVPLTGDAWFIVIADGMGGRSGGAVASRLVVNGLQHHMSSLPLLHALPSAASAEYLIRGMRIVHETILDTAREEPAVGGMGATVACALLCEMRCVHLYAGDSRVYLFRGDQVKYRTRDHSVVQTLVELKQIQPEEIKGHPHESTVLSHLGAGKAWSQIQISPGPSEGSPLLELEAGDVLVMCTDGLTTELDDREIATHVLARVDRPSAEIAAALMEAALGRGGRDNVTVVVARVLPFANLLTPGITNRGIQPSGND